MVKSIKQNKRQLGEKHVVINDLRNAREASQVVFQSKYWFASICLLFGFFLFVSTMRFDYVLDDKSIIPENPSVTKGFKGIESILFMTDGNTSARKLGYYRPLSLITFAIENQFFHQNPHVSHFINAMLYAITSFILCLLLFRLLNHFNAIFPFIVSLLFIVHPVHTEVVANIKSRDEILSFLNLILSIYIFLIAVFDKQMNIKLILISYIFFYLALLSKETALIGLFLIPIILYFNYRSSVKAMKQARKESQLLIKKILFFLAPFFLLALVYQAQKHIMVGDGTGWEVNDIVTYPYSAVDTKIPSTLNVFLRYLKLTFLPYPLSYNYAYNQVPTVSWTSPGAIGGLLFAVVLVYWSVIELRRKSAIGLGLIIYEVTMLPALGFTLMKGGNMAERLLYAPVLGSSLVLAYLILKATRFPLDQPRLSNIPLRNFLIKTLPLAAIIILCSFHTVSRTKIWKDNLTLFSHDVRVVPNSCQVHFHYATELADIARTEKDSLERRKLFLTAVDQLHECIHINPRDADAYLLLGYCYQNGLKYYDSAYYSYNASISLVPRYPLGYNNLGVLFESFGYQEYASYYYNKSIEMDPSFVDGMNNHNRHLKATGLDIKQLPKKLQ